MQTYQLLHLLQLSSPALPTGAYSYSEGLETLCDRGFIHDQASLIHWLERELQYGAIRMEAAAMLRAYRATEQLDRNALVYWNHWLTATRETSELRSQSWQMGQSLIKLVRDMALSSLDRSEERISDNLAKLIDALPSFKEHSDGRGCNLAIAYGLTAAMWQIDEDAALTGYLYSWLANLVSAGVKLIPLGQTVGQQILFGFNLKLEQVVGSLLTLPDIEMESCSWGMAIASMNHETQYSRLFRS